MNEWIEIYDFWYISGFGITVESTVWTMMNILTEYILTMFHTWLSTQLTHIIHIYSRWLTIFIAWIKNILYIEVLFTITIFKVHFKIYNYTLYITDICTFIIITMVDNGGSMVDKHSYHGTTVTLSFHNCNNRVQSKIH